MTLTQLIDLLDAGYPADGIGGLKQADLDGDSLATFILQELKDTYISSTTDDEQLFEARRVMHNAQKDIESVISLIDDRRCLRRRKEKQYKCKK